MSFVVYIMHSEAHNKNYIGQTQNLIARFKDHNLLGKKGWARSYRPWKVVHVEFFETKREALDREKFLKTGKGRQWVKEKIQSQT